jgi:hypothetical protein
MDPDRPLAGAPLQPLPLEALPPLPPLRLAVVGQVEWVSFVGVDHLPVAGEILRATHSQDLAGGGGAVIAVQLAKLTGQRIPFFTALGRDRIGELAAEQLEVWLALVADILHAPQFNSYVHNDQRAQAFLVRVLHPQLHSLAASALKLSAAPPDLSFITAAGSGPGITGYNMAEVTLFCLEDVLKT